MFKKNATTLKKQMYVPRAKRNAWRWRWRWHTKRSINRRPMHGTLIHPPPHRWWKQLRMKMVLGLAILAVLLVIIIPIAVTAKRFVDANRKKVRPFYTRVRMRVCVNLDRTHDPPTHILKSGTLLYTLQMPCRTIKNETAPSRKRARPTQTQNTKHKKKEHDPSALRALIIVL